MYDEKNKYIEVLHVIKLMEKWTRKIGKKIFITTANK